jgi:hypothetical protein
MRNNIIRKARNIDAPFTFCSKQLGHLGIINMLYYRYMCPGLPSM